MGSSSVTDVQLAGIPLAALAAVAILGLPVIGLLARAGAGQRVREDGPQRHLEKEGTPTMGGLLILGAAIAVAIGGQMWIDGTVNSRLATLLAAALAFGCIGALDDWMKITRGRSLGLRAREKLLLQILAAVAFVYALGGERMVQTALAPEGAAQHIGPVWGVFWVLAIVATSNAVNLADGLDGLAAGLCTIAAAGFALLALKAGEREVAIMGLALAGACLGFLGFNRHPARIFMGDVGSLALGGALAAMAARLNQPLALIGLCLVPFIEELSVIAQVVSFKTTGRRVFRMSPIHHHFELSGWSERRVVLTFWTVGALAAGAVVAAGVMT
jgi:phospho-N-acetylmuramoyl-pentapeptide-transferase